MFLFVFLQLLIAVVIVGGSILGLMAVGLTKSNTIKSCLVTLWGFIFFVIALSMIIKPFMSKKVLEKSDYYGQYVIDTTYFNSAQAKWQYDHFRFEIKENDSIYFYVTEKERIIKTYKGSVKYPSPYGSARLKFKMKYPPHHILETPPTIYRSIWSFRLVFNSRKYNNMYFIKD